MPRRYTDAERAQRFWSRVDKSGGPGACWEFTGSPTKGYGRIANPDSRVKYERAHRFTWRITFGDVPSGLCVLHSCDNPPCVNPSHLFIGTKADNNRDKLEKGRARCPRGEAVTRARLTAPLIIEIRERSAQGERALDIARRYGVSRSAIYHVLHRRVWRHVVAGSEAAVGA